jgi:hypothetical protein
MTISKPQISDPAMLAKEDLASNYNKWHEAERKPGEVKIARQFRDYRSFLINQKMQKEKELQLKEKQLEYAHQFDTSDSKRQEIDAKIKDEICRLKDDLKQVGPELQKVEEAITRHKIRYPEFKEQIEAVAIETPVSNTKSNWFLDFGKNILLIGMLIFICVFDAYNMYTSLEKFAHDPTKYQILCSFIFCAVLYTSYNLKKNNTVILWVGFLLFVTAANVPQFLGRDPVFGVTNLLKSPSHIIVFVISFFGSILITLINQKLGKVKIVEVEENIPILPELTENEINDRVQFNQLLRKREELLLKEKNSSSQINEKEKQLITLAQVYDDKEKATIDEKLGAIVQISKEQTEMEEEIEQFQVKIEYLPEELKDYIEKYRQEVEILQIINSYPKTVNYQDINSITI